MSARGTLSTGLATAVLALFGQGCLRPQVEGSLGELIDLHYDHVEISMNPPIDFTLPYQERLLALGQARVKYLESYGAPDTTADDNVIFEVTAAFWGTPDYVPGVTLDLAEYRANGNQRGEVARNVSGEPGYSFPSLERGTFVLFGPPNEGVPVDGSFSVTFQNWTAFASGRTVFQRFEATLR